MSTGEREPRRKHDWIGRYVRLKRELQTNGGTVFRAGEIMRVKAIYRGLALTVARSCPVCARSYREEIHRVAYDDVDLLPPDFQPGAALD